MNQVRRPLPDGSVVLASSREVPDGARAPLLVADDLFRLDVRYCEDTVTTAVRDLSGGWLEDRSSTGYAGACGQHEFSFRIADPGGAVDVEAVLASLRDADRGVTRFTVQARVRAS